MPSKANPRRVAQKDHSKYPFMNLSLDDMDGEEWRDIPGCDGYLMVSDYGRVLSLPRPIRSSSGQFYHTKLRIRKQTLAKYYNPHTNDFTEQLSVHIRYEGPVTIAR